MKRDHLINKLTNTSEFDVIVIGGGASGLGVALDSVSRGYSTLLVEREDFGKGTSSKATKLLHGGVRYLAQGDIPLVYEALHERTNIIKNAPHLSETLPFIIPIYSWWDAIVYYVGLTFYSILAGTKSLGKTKWVSVDKIKKRIPNLELQRLKGGVEYYDGQFDDARLCIDVVHTIHNLGGICLNYTSFTDFLHGVDGFDGIKITDHIANSTFSVKGKSIVNASGVFFDEVMSKQNIPQSLSIVPSRGAHIILDKKFLMSDTAIMIPKTTDGRVLFIIPWKNVCIVGTTDTVADKIEINPVATEEDIDFILTNAQQYLADKPTRSDIKSTFAGLRPLAAPKKEGRKSKEISRSHKVIVTNNNLFSLLGGKWTSFRKMGEDTIDTIIKKKILQKSKSTSADLKIDSPNKSNTEAKVNYQSHSKDFIHPQLPYTWAELEHIVALEFVYHADDLLARRTRCLFLDKKATLTIADQAIKLIAKEHNYDQEWEDYENVLFEEFSKSF